MISTARAIRIDEMISEGIKKGKKFTPKDMIDIQTDFTDVIARELVPHVIKIANHVLENQKTHKLSKDQSTEI